MTQLRRHLLHCINLSGPHDAKVIFYCGHCVCQSLINPCTPSILLREREGEDGDTEASYNSPLPTLFSSPSLSRCPVFILFVFIPYASPCLPSACLPFHPPHTNTHCIFLFFPAPHGGPNIFPRGTHFSQAVMNGSGSRIDFQTETI